MITNYNSEACSFTWTYTLQHYVTEPNRSTTSNCSSCHCLMRKTTRKSWKQPFSLPSPWTWAYVWAAPSPSALALTLTPLQMRGLVAMEVAVGAPKSHREFALRLCLRA